MAILCFSAFTMSLTTFQIYRKTERGKRVKQATWDLFNFCRPSAALVRGFKCIYDVTDVTLSRCMNKSSAGEEGKNSFSSRRPMRSERYTRCIFGCSSHLTFTRQHDITSNMSFRVESSTAKRGNLNPKKEKREKCQLIKLTSGSQTESRNQSTKWWQITTQCEKQDISLSR